MLSCWNRNNNKVSHFFIHIIYWRDGAFACELTLHTRSHSWCTHIHFTRSTVSLYTFSSFRFVILLFLFVRSLHVSSFRSQNRHYAICNAHKLFTCSVQTVRIKASQATLVSCVVFYYYAVINFCLFLAALYHRFSFAWPRKSCLWNLLLNQYMHDIYRYIDYVLCLRSYSRLLTDLKTKMSHFDLFRQQ